MGINFLKIMNFINNNKMNIITTINIKKNNNNFLIRI